MFAAANAKPKPAQPVKTVSDLLTLSIQAQPELEALMPGVRDVVDVVPGLKMGGVE